MPVGTTSLLSMVRLAHISPPEDWGTLLCVSMEGTGLVKLTWTIFNLETMLDPFSCHQRQVRLFPRANTIYGFTNLSTDIWKHWGWGFPSRVISSRKPQTYLHQSGYFEGETQQSGWSLWVHPWTSWHFLRLPFCSTWEKTSFLNSPLEHPLLFFSFHFTSRHGPCTVTHQTGFSAEVSMPICSQ